MTKEQIEALKTRLDSLRSFLDIEKKRHDLAEQEQISLQPDFWNDPVKAETLLKKVRGSKQLIEKFDAVEKEFDDMVVLEEFREMGETNEEEVRQAEKVFTASLEDLESRSTLSEPEDQFSAILEINSLS